VVFDIFAPDGIARAVAGEKIGTLINAEGAPASPEKGKR
jgi:hypothetical protein